MDGCPLRAVWRRGIIWPPLADPQLSGFRRAMTKYSDATAMTKALLCRLRVDVRATERDTDLAGIDPTMVFPETLGFWSEHSERGTMNTWMQMAGVPPEVRRMVGLAREFGIRPVLYGGHEAVASAEFLAEHGVPILVNLNWPAADPDADPEAEVSLRTLRLRDQAPAGPAALAAAGVRFAFYRDGSSGSGGGPPGRRGGGAGGRAGSGSDLAAVRTAVERGLDREAALTALTMAPAEIFGVADRVGTLQSGRIANLVIADEDIFEEGAKIETVFVDGVIHRVGSDDEEATDEAETPSRRTGSGRGR